jgi:hypothetical protein
MFVDLLLNPINATSSILVQYGARENWWSIADETRTHFQENAKKI